MLSIAYIILLLAGLYSCTNNNNITVSKEPVNKTAIFPISNTTEKAGNNSTPTETTTLRIILSEEINVQENKTVNLTSPNDLNSTDVADEVVNITDVGGEVTEVKEKKQPGSPVFTYFRTMFRIRPAIGENCTKSEDCEGRESTCLEGLCQCINGYVAALDKRHCLKIKLLGDECIQDAQCSAGLNLPDGDALCTSFRCVCGTDTIYRNGTCLRSIYIGDSCKSDNDCLTVNSHCIEEVCACPSNMIPGAENKHCLPALKNLDNAGCLQDEQCQQSMGDNALCNENKCQCKPRTHFSSDKCVSDLRLGEACNQTSDCLISQSFETKDQRDCVDNKCVCAAGFSEVAGEDVCISSANNIFSRLVILHTLLFLVILRLYS